MRRTLGAVFFVLVLWGGPLLAWQGAPGGSGRNWGNPPPPPPPGGGEIEFTPILEFKGATDGGATGWYGDDVHCQIHLNSDFTELKGSDVTGHNKDLWNDLAFPPSGADDQSRLGQIGEVTGYETYDQFLEYVPEDDRLVSIKFRVDSDDVDSGLFWFDVRDEFGLVVYENRCPRLGC